MGLFDNVVLVDIRGRKYNWKVERIENDSTHKVVRRVLDVYSRDEIATGTINGVNVDRWINAYYMAKIIRRTNK